MLNRALKQDCCHAWRMTFVVQLIHPRLSSAAGDVSEEMQLFVD